MTIETTANVADARRRRRWTVRVASALVLLAACVAPAHAQQVLRGRIVDDSTRNGVEGAEVQVALADTTVVARVATDRMGRFWVKLPDAGLYRIQASALGYNTRTSTTFSVARNDTLDIVFGLEADAIALPGLRVETDRPGPSFGRTLFEKHRDEWGRGVFLDQQMIEKLAPYEVGTIFQGVEGTRLRWEWTELESGDRKLIPAPVSKKGRGCFAYMVDGHRASKNMDNAFGLFPLDTLRPEDIAAVEVYRYLGEVPPDLRSQAYLATESGIEIQCGLVVFRTKAAWGPGR
ncbi:MAG: carboxypeptidase regulatory-like domain-containing protein [Gemmatimonadetes bacterium]|nr:MAG: carboxypeptidase regulatory-like domain-containing protein [Gemmatimonadota bacterium]